MKSPIKTILIADDEEDLRTLVEITLEDPQYRIVTADDGERALECIHRDLPDVVILDWMMPKLSGVEVLKKLRQDPRTSTMPVVLLTARDDLANQDEVRTLAVFAYLVKPFSPLELLKKVQEALAR